MANYVPGIGTFHGCCASSQASAIGVARFCSATRLSSSSSAMLAAGVRRKAPGSAAEVFRVELRRRVDLEDFKAVAVKARVYRRT